MSQTPFSPPSKEQILSEQQITHFLTHGHVVIPNCFSREFAEDWTAHAFQRPRVRSPGLSDLGAGDRAYARLAARVHAGDCSQSVAGGV